MCVLIMILVLLWGTILLVTFGVGLFGICLVGV